ncbi:radical SAM protein [Candidatus Bipolaricaulota bacterium]|nr:radical SAM protein [Candidatus Bipolaricaulota bacterium]
MLKKETDYISLFDESIRNLFRDALRISVRNPRMAAFLCGTLFRQRRAARTRQAWEKKGLHVPAFMIASITHRCNLQCSGCYARAHHRPAEAELSPEQLRGVLEEASELGVSVILLAGGEPLTRPGILDITRSLPHVIFPLFTNGLLLDPATIDKLKPQRNVVPVISIEGLEKETDARRGQGVHARLHSTISRLSRANIFFGASITTTRDNFDLVTGERFVRDLLSAGCRLFFFIDYVPVEEGTEAMILTDSQREREAEVILSLRERFSALFVAFPGGEEEFGGCLAAGRGFVHVSPEGRLEPCPFSPFSDVSLKEMSLKEALQSKLLRIIRENSDQLDESKGGCALWEKRDWVASLLQ